MSTGLPSAMPRSFTLGRVADPAQQSRSELLTAASRDTTVKLRMSDGTWVASSTAPYIPVPPPRQAPLPSPRADGRLGPFEPSRVAQWYDSRRPWLPYAWTSGPDDPARYQLTLSNFRTNHWDTRRGRIADRVPIDTVIAAYRHEEAEAKVAESDLDDWEHRIPADTHPSWDELQELDFLSGTLEQLLITTARVQRAITELRGYTLWARYTLAWRSGFITVREPLLPVIGCWVDAGNIGVWARLSYGGVPCWRITVAEPKDPRAVTIAHLDELPLDLNLDIWDDVVHHPRPRHTLSRRKQKLLRDADSARALGNLRLAESLEDEADGAAPRDPYSSSDDDGFVVLDAPVPAPTSMATPASAEPSARRPRYEPQRRGADHHAPPRGRSRSRSPAPRRHSPSRPLSPSDRHWSPPRRRASFDRPRPRPRPCRSQSRSPRRFPSPPPSSCPRRSASLSPPVQEPSPLLRLDDRMRDPSRSPPPTPPHPPVSLIDRIQDAPQPDTVDPAAMDVDPPPLYHSLLDRIMSASQEDVTLDAQSSADVDTAVWTDWSVVDNLEPDPSMSPHILRDAAGRLLSTRVSVAPQDVDAYLSIHWLSNDGVPVPLATWELTSSSLPFADSVGQHGAPPLSALATDTALYLWRSMRPSVVARLNAGPPSTWLPGGTAQWKTRLKPKGRTARVLAPGTTPSASAVAELTDSAGLPWTILTQRDFEQLRWEVRTFLFRRDFERLAFDTHRSTPLADPDPAILLDLRARIRRLWGPRSSFFPSADEPRYFDSADDLVRLRHWRGFGLLLSELRGADQDAIHHALGGSVTGMSTLLLSLFRSYFQDLYKRAPTAFVDRLEY
ncbi:hypothetical protein BV25DRAFT_1921894 [Artomyces pyxidatus]|uniref:Uncharacterized protein n=1 Tax=Artomyces pyxidatus TaxID=48021 RepID=A0ACB8SFJ9_9AGAM|nr:hypothetical protein BV25DRAFT_1921894 [Artomyces pyxidatus]